MANYITDTIKVGDKTYEATEATCENGGKVELETANVVPSTQEQVILPSEGKYIDKVNVEAVSSDIDSEIKSENIKQGVNILGVEGSLISEGYKFTFPEDVEPVRDVFSIKLDDTYTIYSPNKSQSNTYLFNNKTGEREVIYNYGTMSTAVKYKNYILVAGNGRRDKSFIYNLETKQIIKELNCGYSHIEIKNNVAVFWGIGDGYQMYNFETDTLLNLDTSVSVNIFWLTDDIFVTYYARLYIGNVKDFTSTEIKLESSLTTNTDCYSVTKYDDTKYLVCVGSGILLFDYTTNVVENFVRGNTISPSASNIRFVEKAGNSWICTDYSYSTGAVYKIDEVNKVLIKLNTENIQYASNIVTNGTNACIIGSNSLYFYKSSDDSLVKLSSNAGTIGFYQKKIDDTYMLFMTQGYTYYMNMNDGTFVYINNGNSRYVIEGNNKILICCNNTNTSGGNIYILSYDLTDVYKGPISTIEVIKKDNIYYLFNKATEIKNYNTYTVYSFNSLTNEFKMTQAVNIEDII